MSRPARSTVEARRRHHTKDSVVGAALRRLRHDVGLTLAEVDRDLGFAKGGWLAREQGRTPLRASELLAFVEIAGCDLADFEAEVRARQPRKAREPNSLERLRMRLDRAIERVQELEQQAAAEANPWR